jgi:hypothetical protein
MNRTLLDSQIGSRSAEAYIVNYAYERICNQDNAPLQPNTDGYCGRDPQASAGNMVLTCATGNRIVSEFGWTWACAGFPRFQRLTPPAWGMLIKDILGALVTSTSNSH